MKLSSVIENFTSKSYERINTPYIIAEAGVNHECDMNIAKKLIEDAHEGGANAIKFQTYKANTLASRNSPAYWDMKKEKTDSQYMLFKKYDKFWKKEFEILKKACDKNNIEFLSTPFDYESAIFLNDLMEVFKISSSDITNIPFIEFLCDFGKPILLSTGASNCDEIDEAVNIIKSKGNSLSVMHCILNYPTMDENANLGMILDLRNRYNDLLIGYSDHTLPSDMQNVIIATLLGAQVIEKHFTHDKGLPGNDHYHSMDKEDLILLKSNLTKLETKLGLYKKESIKEEATSRLNARRSLFYNKSLKKGSTLKKDDLIFKRPGNGISPSKINQVLNKKLVKDVIEDEHVRYEDLD